MERRKFFRSLTIATGAAIIVPEVLRESPEKEYVDLDTSKLQSFFDKYSYHKKP